MRSNSSAASHGSPTTFCLPMWLALAVACDPLLDSEGPIESASERDCVERIKVNPVCDCTLTLSWDLGDTLDRVGLVTLSMSAKDAQTVICAEGLESALFATAVYSEVTTSGNQVTIDPLSEPTIVFLEIGGEIVDARIADPAPSNERAYLNFDW